MNAMGKIKSEAPETEAAPRGAAGNSAFAAFVMGDDDRLLPVEGRKALTEALRDRAQKALIVYKSPVRLLAQALPDQASALAALDDWAREAEGYASLASRKKDQIVAVEQEAFSDPAVRSAALSRFPGRSLPRQILRSAPGPSSLFEVIASLLIERHEAVSKPYAKLKRCDVRDAEVQASFRSALEPICADLEAFGAWSDGRDVTETLSRQVLDLQWALQTNQVEKRQIEQDRDKDRVRLKAELADARNASEQVGWELKAAQAALDGVYASTSWKVAAPVRFLRRLMP